MTEIRQCWAHDTNGNRCQAKASHRGNHYLKIVWTDEECVGLPLIKVLPDEPIPLAIPTPPPVQVDVTSCVACHHRHRGGECKCSCKEFIG
jgi:hypothetical protein